MAEYFFDYRIYDYNKFEDFEQFIISFKTSNTKYIWLKNAQKIAPNQINEFIDLLEAYQLKVLIEEDIDLAKNLKVEGVLTNEAENIIEYKKENTNLKFGVIANDIAESKNGELFGADFIFLGPFEKIGLEPYVSLSPIKPDYEWMFLNIIIPIIPFGDINVNDEEELISTCKIGGIVK